MIPVSFTVTPDLRETLVAIDNLRRIILTIPLLPKTELKLRFSATVERIYASLILAGKELSKLEIIGTLTNPPKRLSMRQKDITAYKKALDYIATEWVGNTKPFSFSTIETIALTAVPGDNKKVRKEVASVEQSVRQLVSLLEVKSDHPVIQAAIAHAVLVHTFSGGEDAGRIALLTTWLILSKFGFDLRGMLAIETQLLSVDTYKRAIQTIELHGHLTGWLEYYAKQVQIALELLREHIVGKAAHDQFNASAHLFEISDRQKAILTIIENPAATITNRAVTKRFRVSQITASRDLTKLVSIGLLYSHGKGRSVYYTRV